MEKKGSMTRNKHLFSKYGPINSLFPFNSLAGTESEARQQETESDKWRGGARDQLQPLLRLTGDNRCCKKGQRPQQTNVFPCTNMFTTAEDTLLVPIKIRSLVILKWKGCARQSNPSPCAGRTKHFLKESLRIFGIFESSVRFAWLLMARYGYPQCSRFSSTRSVQMQVKLVKEGKIIIIRRLNVKQTETCFMNRLEMRWLSTLLFRTLPLLTHVFYFDFVL